jgi:hypothetical protein
MKPFTPFFKPSRIQLEIPAGSRLADVLQYAVYLAKENKCIVYFDFNEINLTVNESSNVETMRKLYFQTLDAKQ